jgi:hypothetical protein
MEESEKLGVDMANALESFVNNYSRQPQQACVKRLMQSHRTLQQSLARLFLSYFEELSKQNTDLRNEAAVELAKQIMELPARTRALPFI